MITLLSIPRSVQAASDDGVFTAVVTSDLHFTAQDDASDVIVSAMSCSREITEAFTDQVIDLKPDAWIITGDMTNSADAEDEKELAKILKKAADAGVEVIITTGNHDYDSDDIRSFRENFYGLQNKTSEDEASLSYSTVIDGVRLLAMDDGSAVDDRGASALFSDETMNWLRSQLEEAREKEEKVLFLAHRSVLFETGYNSGVDYTIENEDLESLLREYDVRLCLVGHQHSQAILEKDGLYEIMSCMPLTGKHRFGWLTADEEGLLYEGRQIDLEKYSSAEDYAAIEEVDLKQAEQTTATVDHLLEIVDNDAEVRENSGDLLMSFFRFYEEGTIGAHAEELLEDEAWPEVEAAIADTNYGPWITSILENPPLDAYHLELNWK